MYNSFQNITNRILNQWPIVRTTKMDDWSLADKYEDTSPYVWYVNTNYKVKEDFPFSWRPPSDQMFNIHSFPRCVQRTRQPIRWDMVRLVPTSKRKRIAKEIKQPIISSFNKNKCQLFSFSFDDRATMRKLKTQHEVWPEIQVIKNTNGYAQLYKSVGRRALTDHVWMFDIDFKFGANFDLDFVPDSQDSVYMWKTHTTAHDIAYPSGAVMFVPRKLLTQGFGAQDIHVVDDIAGTINATADPFRAWSRAFKTAVDYTVSDITYTDSKAIIQASLTTDKGNLKNYVRKGTQAGIEYAKSGSVADIDDIQTLKEMFRNHK
jgi:hypothetical protein